MKSKSHLIPLQVILLLCVTLSLAQERNPQPVSFERVSDRLYEIPGGRGARSAAYIGDNGILVIDAKMGKESVDQLMAGLKRISPKPVLYLVNTHSDGDHVTGNQFFPETVTIVAHENCRKEFFHATRDGTPSVWNRPELAPFLPEQTFREKMDLYLGSKKVELWYFGLGHTTGDLVVYIPEEKAAFLGDQIFLSRPQLIHSYKGGNSFEWVQTVSEMLAHIDAERFFSGHSEIADRAGIKSHVDQMKERQNKVRSLVGKGASLEETKAQFSGDESRLIEVIYAEVKRQNQG